MGHSGGSNNSQAENAQQQMFAQEQAQSQALYQRQLQQEQSSFANNLANFTSTENKNLSAQVKPNPGAYYGAIQIPQGTYLSPSGTRNTFLGG